LSNRYADYICPTTDQVDVTYKICSALGKCVNSIKYITWIVCRHERCWQISQFCQACLSPCSVFAVQQEPN